MYDWDAKKSAQNKKKHGISFEEARDAIFEAPNIIVNGVAYDQGEIRNAIIGRFEGKFFTGIFTLRLSRIRIISVRRSRYEEEKQAKNRGI